MVSTRYKYGVGQVVNMGNKKVTITELREFYGKPSYMVNWFDKENKLWKAVLKEDEIS